MEGERQETRIQNSVEVDCNMSGSLMIMVMMFSKLLSAY